MVNIILFGAPGAGKGTQSKLLMAKYKLVHISTGDLLHREVMARTELGLQAKQLMKEGKLVPNEIVIGMIDHQLQVNCDCPGFIFDGFPRTMVQAEALDEILAKNEMQVHAVIALEVEEEELVQRVLQRGKEKGRFYDQNESIVRSRVQSYFQETAPLAKFYQRRQQFYSIPGQGKVEDIFLEVSKIIENNS